jgi:DNA-binding NarL/FixJ family response regulator
MSHLGLYAATAAHLRALQARAYDAPAAACESAEEAARIYRELGWPLHEARALEIAVNRDGVFGVAAVATPVLHSIEGLSTREREVAALVASGNANNRIAARLALSERTVEKHLTSIYGKLGLHNRAELAAFVAEARSHQEAGVT